MQELVWLFVISFISSAIILALYKLSANTIRKIALPLSVIPLVLLIYGHGHWIGTSINYNWLPALSIQFHLSIDSMSLIFLYLTAIVTPISLFALNSSRLSHPHTFYALILFLQGLLIGFFTTRDLVFFIVFYEAMLIPLYFIISLWGGAERQAAALKFLIYMIAGSVLMMANALFLYMASGSFDLDTLATVSQSLPQAGWIAAIFILAFSVKTPLFPFHAWLPDAYCQASTAGTILLSAILSKAGIYGFLRINGELFPSLMLQWSPFLLTFAIIGVLYGALAAWRQNDFKRLLAYSSFSHVNFVLVGVFVASQTAQTGAILQALNHGLTITALFLTAWWLEERLGSTAIGQIKGLAKFLPHLCWLTLFFVLSSVALPGTNNFIGEILILFGLFEKNPWAAAILGTSVILSVIYMLRWMQKVYFEEPGFCQNTWIDIRKNEFFIALPLILLILWIGIYPAPLLKQIEHGTVDSNVIATVETQS